jgi:hypothetical protein
LNISLIKAESAMKIKIFLIYFIFIFQYAVPQGFWGNEFPEPKIEYKPKSYVCYKTPDPIIIDGKLNDPIWAKVDFTESFVDIEGSLKPKPFYDTKVKMAWDENYFYFGAVMEEPHVWATLTARDAVIFKDNDFEIFLDPDGDTHNYYELEVNALETEWDLLLLKPYHDGKKVAVDSWDIPGLITKVHVDGTLNNPSDQDRSWSVEIAIPWKALEECAPNKLPLEGEQWKVNFSRVQWDVEIVDNKYVKTDTPEFNWVWSPQGLIYMHMPDLWGLVQFTHFSPGSKEVAFQSSKIDRIKLALRRVYWRQSNYYLKYEKYTASLKKLNLLEKPISGVPWPPEIVLTPSGWEAKLDWKDKIVIIQKDGKVWQR